MPMSGLNAPKFCMASINMQGVASPHGLVGIPENSQLFIPFYSLP